MQLLDWPPKFPDANIIEQLWHEIERAANCRRPQNAEQLLNALVEACHRSRTAHMRNLVDSMPRRTFAIQTARGGNISTEWLGEGLQSFLVQFLTFFFENHYKYQRELQKDSSPTSAIN